MILQYESTPYWIDDSPSIPHETNPYGWIYALAGCAVILVAMYIASRWAKGRLGLKFRSGKSKFNKEKLLEAYIHLGAAMLKSDKKDARQKLQYVQQYALRYFPKYNDDIAFEFNHALNNPIEVKQVCTWLKFHLNKDQRLKVLYFLAGMSVVDGSMNSRESKLLRVVCGHFDLTQKDFDSIIAMYTQRKRRTTNKNSTKSFKSIRIETSCKILGVSPHASMNEIKKAYRKMVKLHHPDRFAASSKSEQKIANERFIEIQKAYETLEKHR